jgi:hypothetical protein
MKRPIHDDRQLAHGSGDEGPRDRAGVVHEAKTDPELDQLEDDVPTTGNGAHEWPHARGGEGRLERGTLRPTLRRRNESLLPQLPELDRPPPREAVPARHDDDLRRTHESMRLEIGRRCIDHSDAYVSGAAPDEVDGRLRIRRRHLDAQLSAGALEGPQSRREEMNERTGPCRDHDRMVGVLASQTPNELGATLGRLASERRDLDPLLRQNEATTDAPIERHTQGLGERLELRVDGRLRAVQTLRRPREVAVLREDRERLEGIRRKYQ